MMSKYASNKPKIGLVITTALASVILSGCSTKAAPIAASSVEKAQTALVKGKTDKAVTHSEAAVLAAPRNGEYRALLGGAYLKEGRFQSAATSFSDAIALGNTDARTILSYALAETAVGNSQVALSTLKQFRDSLDAADLGLAYALAGEPARGVHVLSNALREGQTSVKLRQNLAYAYALQGNWRAARLMAAEDVPANQINQRIAEWAANVSPEAYQTRVAKLLNVTPVQDAGLPSRLALTNFPSNAQIVADAAASAPSAITAPAPEPMLASNGELPAVGSASAAPVVKAQPVLVAAASAEAAAQPDKPRFAASFGSPVAKVAAAPTTPSKPRFVSSGMVQKLPATYNRPDAVKAASAPKIAAAPTVKKVSGTHLVQLGSFNSRAVAEAASKKFQARFSQLSDRDMLITEARLKGKTYWRVAAAGFNHGSSKTACASLKTKKQACFVYSAALKLPGAVDQGIRIAAR